jgi:hypothetical protein
MYSSGIIYTGTDYAIYSDKDMAETVLFQDFYINHRNGGGIRLPQGAHQMFERFFSSACAENYYGVLIEGATGEPTEQRPDRETAGYGSYMVSFNGCRFWSEQGYRGTGVRVEESILCTTFNNCFFSRAITNRPHLELYRCDTVTLNNCAFERSEQPVAPADPANGRTEEMVQEESRIANGAITAPLVHLDQCHAVTFQNCHVEMVFESFIRISGNTSGVYIDGARLSHYAISLYNPNKGYVVVVDPDSLESRDIIISRRNYRSQANHEYSPTGPEYLDPVGCVTVEHHYDHTSYQNDNYLHERRTVPRMGMSGDNLLCNPSLFSFEKTGHPIYLDLVQGPLQFTQLDYKSGINLKYEGPPSTFNRFRMKTVESLDKYDFYTFVVVGKNNSGATGQIWIDIGGDTNDFGILLPSGNQQFTQTYKVNPKATDVIDVVIYNPMNVDIYAMYLIPGLVSEIPYGSEAQSSSVVTAVNVNTASVKLSPVASLPTAGWNSRGMVVRQEVEGQDDKLLVCKRKADGSFAWVEIL